MDFKNLKINGIGPARTTMMKLANSDRYVEVENPEYTKLKNSLNNK